MELTARGFLADLKRNVDAWYADQIDDQAFRKRQRAIWDAIQNAGPRVREQVLHGLRKELPPVRRARGGR